jgi:hypothetical protein
VIKREEQAYIESENYIKFKVLWIGSGEKSRPQLKARTLCIKEKSRPQFKARTLKEASIES